MTGTRPYATFTKRELWFNFPDLSRKLNHTLGRISDFVAIRMGLGVHAIVAHHAHIFMFKIVAMI